LHDFTLNDLDKFGLTGAGKFLQHLVVPPFSGVGQPWSVLKKVSRLAPQQEDDKTPSPPNTVDVMPIHIVIDVEF
jgi:hypothetical protein